MIWDSCVGKSSLVFQLCEGRWNVDTKPAVATPNYVLHGDAARDQGSIQIWGTAGGAEQRLLPQRDGRNSCLRRHVPRAVWGPWQVD